MTKPKLLRLVPLDIPVDYGTVEGHGGELRAYPYHLGLDAHGNLWLTYQHWFGNQPRVSVHDPHWNPHHGLRYVEWVNEP